MWKFIMGIQFGTIVVRLDNDMAIPWYTGAMVVLVGILMLLEWRAEQK